MAMRSEVVAETTKLRNEQLEDARQGLQQQVQQEVSSLSHPTKANSRPAVNMAVPLSRTAMHGRTSNSNLVGTVSHRSSCIWPLLGHCSWPSDHLLTTQKCSNR